MMRTALVLTGSVLAVAAAAAPGYARDASSREAPAAHGALDVRPAAAAPGATVRVSAAGCDGGHAAAGDAEAVGAPPFTLAAGDEGAAGRFRVPDTAQPGTYEIVARCAGGGLARGDLAVTEAAARPAGAVHTGVGGALGPDPAQTAAGVAALAVAAAGGTWLLHRRARGDGI
ncbi:hypothetical protein [Streptomyces sp. NPDC050560]|uniref:hypothetical protein n=1 Tax=Streptomyces sp. NPDC050560 TaxID=3365630 RepID=UPI0037B13ECA